MNDEQILRATSTQIQEQKVAALLDIWDGAGEPSRLEFLEMLDDWDVSRARLTLENWPDSWFEMLRLCASCGIREAILGR
jgi:hypothetical protein